MVKKKSIRSKRVNNYTENEILHQKKSRTVKTFLKDIGVLITLMLFLLLAINKILTTFGDIRWTGWFILGGCFALIVGMVIWVAPRIKRIIRITEAQAESITIIIFVGIVILAAYDFWDYITVFFKWNAK